MPQNDTERHRTTQSHRATEPQSHRATEPQSHRAKEPKPPYYVVVFASQRTGDDTAAYAEMTAQMMALAAAQPGYLGVDSIANDDGQSITCSYWQTTADIEAWQANAQHLMAQQQGRAVWYANYRLTVAKVERTSGFERDGA